MCMRLSNHSLPLIIIFLSQILFYSCSPQKEATQEIKIVKAQHFEEVTIDFPESFEILKEVTEIQDTPLSRLLPGVFTHDSMVFYDTSLNVIMKFDYDGNLLKQKELHRGNGPGEINGLVQSVRSCHNEGYLITCFSRIILLDSEFNHKDTYAINFKTKDAFDIGDGEIVVCGYNPENQMLFHIYSYQGIYKKSLGKPFFENKQAEMYSMYCKPYFFVDSHLFASSIFNYKIGAYTTGGDCDYILDGNMDIQNWFLNSSISTHILSIFSENEKLYLTIIDYKKEELYLDIWNLNNLELDKRILFKNDTGYPVYKDKDTYIFFTGAGFFIAKEKKNTFL